MAHIFSWLQLCHHPFFTGMVELFFPHHRKNRIVNHPQNSTFDSQMLSPQQSYSRCWRCSRTGGTLRIATASLLCASIALQSENQAAQKNGHDHGEKASTESGSKELTEHSGSDDSGHAPPLGTIKGRCPDPPIAQQPRPFEKKQPFSPQFVKCANLRIRTHQEEKQGHFWPCQLRSLCPSTSIKGKRQGMSFAVKSKVSLLRFAYFHPKNVTNTHLLLCHHSRCSFKHSTINWKWRENQSHRWRLVALML